MAAHSNDGNTLECRAGLSGAAAAQPETMRFAAGCRNGAQAA